ncbi:Dipeptidase [Succinivibrio dextrinosolvens]|nr:Dipeptidase [Succinivibrio dextrinosolvens]
MIKLNKLFLSIVISTSLLSTADAGTVMYVSPQASDNGTAYLSFSMDRKVSPNVMYVEAADHESDEMREIYEDGDPSLKFLGQIPQVNHTFAYIKTEYGIINENSLMLGFCENSSALKSAKSKPSEKAILSLQEITKLTLERCVKASDAIAMLAQMIDTYGYYGTPATLVISDKEEGYVIELMPAVNNAGGYYVARKIPQGHFFVAADQFRIQSIDKNNPDFIFNENLTSTMQQADIAQMTSGSLNWLRSVKGNEIRPYYSLRRVWRALSIVAPSKNYSPWVSGWATTAYPFSVEPDNKISLLDLIALTRDTYTGTQFDNATKGTGGLFATPYTHENYGERSIANENTTYTFISQANKVTPSAITWLSLGPSGEGTYVPLTVNKIPSVYADTSRTEYDEKKMWWLSKRISYLTVGYYSSLSDMLKTRVLEQEQHSLTLINHSKGLPKERFNRVIENNSRTAFNRMQKLYENLLEKHDGGYMLRYAEGHNPKFIPVDSYKKHEVVHVDKEKEKAELQKKEMNSANLKKEGIPFYNAIGIDKLPDRLDINVFSKILTTTQEYMKKQQNNKN